MSFVYPRVSSIVQLYAVHCVQHHSFRSLVEYVMEDIIFLANNFTGVLEYYSRGSNSQSRKDFLLHMNIFITDCSDKLPNTYQDAGIEWRLNSISILQTQHLESDNPPDTLQETVVS
jgi:hypothetical protein